MAIPFFVSAGTKGAGAGSVTPGTPENIQDDDILLLHIEGEGEDGDADAAPSVDWTLVATVASGTDSLPGRTRHTLYWHRYDSASPPSFVVPDAGNHTLAVVTAWRGCITTESPIHAVQTSFGALNNTGVSADGVTSTVDGCALVASLSAGQAVSYGSWAAGANVYFPPLPANEVVDETVAVGSSGSLHVAWGGFPFASASGAITATASANAQEANIVLALKPKPFVVGELATPTGTVRGFKIWYTDGTNYKSTSLTLPNLRTEWGNQTKSGVMLVVIRFQDKFGIYNKGGIHVERFYREFMRYAPTGSTDWRVWYNPPTQSFGAGAAAQMPSLGEWKDYTDSALLATDNSGNDLDDVPQTWDAALSAAYATEYSETARDES